MATTLWLVNAKTASIRLQKQKRRWPTEGCNTQTASSDLILAQGGIQLAHGGDGRMQRKPNSQWHARVFMPNMFRARAQWSWFAKKPTSDKYSTSERLKGKSSPVPAATRRTYKHLQIPPDESKYSSLYFPWERLCRDAEETTFQPNMGSTV